MKRNILSNRMYLYKNKGCDRNLEAFYADHLSVFDDLKVRFTLAFYFNMCTLWWKLVDNLQSYFILKQWCFIVSIKCKFKVNLDMNKSLIKFQTAQLAGILKYIVGKKEPAVDSDTYINHVILPEVSWNKTSNNSIYFTHGFNYIMTEYSMTLKMNGKFISGKHWVAEAEILHIQIRSWMYSTQRNQDLCIS